MKRCTACNDFALYEDSEIVCPVCGSRLVTYVRSPQPQVNVGINMPNMVSVNDTTPRFETRNGNTYTFRGIVTEVSSQTRSYSRPRQIFNALFRGEPYQLGSTTYNRGAATCYRTRIRIEEFVNARLSTEKRELIFFGDCEGRITYGDDVTITAKKRGDRYIIKSLRCNDTSTNVKAEAQIPPTVVWSIVLTLACFLIALVAGVSEMASTGELTGLIANAMLPMAVIWYIVYRIRRRRRRR